ncbi:VWA domain-containing protein [Collimonas fungivorans]|uniref:VWA domain-containing protein n=1 Tax=Collimonas fungivorans TaxID=158899 RepID=UPI003FA37FAC
MTLPSSRTATQDALIAQWRTAWPQALAAWSRFTRLRDARLCQSRVEAAKEGLSGSFAMIRLMDQSVVVDMETVSAIGLQDYAVEILAHEIGHHVLAPGSATDQFRLLARMRRALPTLERHAALAANLYTDLFINDRLQRQANLRMADIYRLLAKAGGNAAGKSQSGVWALYMRIYEYLWSLDQGSLGGNSEVQRLDTDAWLGARLIRVYANDWMNGAGRFATLLLPYLVDDIEAQKAMNAWHDTKDAAEGCDPYGAQEIEQEEIDGAIHPVNDARISGSDDDGHAPTQPVTHSKGQTREPFEYGEILKAAGIKLSDHEIAVRYYRERALPHLLPFPTRLLAAAPEPQLEGLEPWEIGDPLDQIDWLQSVMQSPRPIPGLTTMRRTYGEEMGVIRSQLPVDLDMYIDSSGSMPNPQVQTSYLTLAGAIIALSALRAGARVQVTLWSGKNEYTATPGFVGDDKQILGVLTKFYGGATCFPIHQLRDTFSKPRARSTHILMISDDGITTMFDQDEKGGSGWDVAAKALAAGGAGGTMALNLPASWENGPNSAWMQKSVDDLKRARCEQGWEIFAVTQFDELMAFARAFSRRHYSDHAATAAQAQGKTP